MALGKFIQGAFVGGVMAAAGLSLASLATPGRFRVAEAPPADAAPEAEPEPIAEVVPQPVPKPMAEADAAPVEPATNAPVITTDAASAVPGPGAEPAASAEAPAAVEDEVSKPSTEGLAALAPADAPVALTEPAPKAADPLPAADGAAPPLPSAPTVPAADQLTVEVVPAPKLPDGPVQPPQPDQDAALAKVEAPAASPQEALLADAGTTVVPAVPEGADGAPAAPEVPSASAADTVPEAAPEPLPEVTMPALEPDAAESALPGDEAGDMPGQKPEGLVRPPATVTDESPETTDAGEPGPAATFKPEPGFGNKTEGVIIGRLPRIGDEPAEDPDTGEAAPDTMVESAPPLLRFASLFENPDSKPVFAVVLIDTGEPDLDRTTLAALPFPVAFAIDPLAPDAAERATIYRAAGQEVVMLATGIADGSNASDIEVAFQSMAQGLPEAVAVMDEADHNFQGNRPLASMVVPVIAAQGRGLLTWDQGLNAADQVARRVNLAATVVFRNLDGAGEDRVAIRRVLDRAAFKAGQDGHVTVVGQTRPETIAALLEWTVEGRAANVVLAPLSAALTVQ